MPNANTNTERTGQVAWTLFFNNMGVLSRASWVQDGLKRDCDDHVEAEMNTGHCVSKCKFDVVSNLLGLVRWSLAAPPLVNQKLASMLLQLRYTKGQLK